MVIMDYGGYGGGFQSKGAWRETAVGYPPVGGKAKTSLTLIYSYDASCGHIFTKYILQQHHKLFLTSEFLNCAVYTHVNVL